MDNLDPNAGQGSDNLDPNASGAGDAGAGAGDAGAGDAGAGAFTWKSNLSPDIVNSSLLQKFPDTKDGLAQAMTSHLNLEKLLGHEKVPIPKDEKDTAGWAMFSKAMGIPDKADAYGLPDAEIPAEMKGLTFDKQKFAETVHAFKLTPRQAQGLWEQYTNMTKESYANHMKQQEESIKKTVNILRSKWGDAYETNVNLGKMVIGKFAPDAESADFITASLIKDPRGIEFLSKIGSQFAENKVGAFAAQRFSLAPEEAANELQKIRSDPNHPYMSERATEQEHQAAVDYVNRLEAIVARARQG